MNTVMSINGINIRCRIDKIIIMLLFKNYEKAILDKIIPVATDTFKEEVFPFMGICTYASMVFSNPEKYLILQTHKPIPWGD